MSGPLESPHDELVVCSLEAWDDVWRRNQFIVDGLLRRNTGLRVLFAEPAADPLFDIMRWRSPTWPRVRTVGYEGRLRAYRPLKALPRRIGPLADRLQRAQVRLAARLLGFARPTLWINDVTYAPLIDSTGWPSVYDVTDDWLLAPGTARELDRIRRLDNLALERADEVVVCSASLNRSRGVRRPVSLIPNAVDTEHFRTPQERPADFPAAPTAVYVGALHHARIDVDLVCQLASALPELRVLLVGPDALNDKARGRLESMANVSIVGPRSYETVPAYLQHADVVIVPHVVSPFTESLDPIKVYECLAVDTPSVATPVAGFRDHAEVLDVVDRDQFVDRVRFRLGQPRDTRPAATASWDDRVEAFEHVLARASGREAGTRT